MGGNGMYERRGGSTHHIGHSITRHGHTLVMILKGARSGSPRGLRVTLTCKTSSLGGRAFLSPRRIGVWSGRSLLSRASEGCGRGFFPLATGGVTSVVGAFLGESEEFEGVEVHTLECASSS